VVASDLTHEELQALLGSGDAVLKVGITIMDRAGRQILDVLDVECAPEVAVEEWWE
jgi:hypothetical protein